MFDILFAAGNEETNNFDNLLLLFSPISNKQIQTSIIDVLGLASGRASDQ